MLISTFTNTLLKFKVVYIIIGAKLTWTNNEQLYFN